MTLICPKPYFLLLSSMNHLFHHVTYQHEHNCYLHWKLRNLNIFLLLMSPIPFLCLTQDSINHDDSDFDDLTLMISTVMMIMILTIMMISTNVMRHPEQFSPTGGSNLRVNQHLVEGKSAKMGLLSLFFRIRK